MPIAISHTRVKVIVSLLELYSYLQSFFVAEFDFHLRALLFHSIITAAIRVICRFPPGPVQHLAFDLRLLTQDPQFVTGTWCSPPRDCSFH